MMTTDKVAEHLGLSPSTIRAYRAIGRFPEPDGWHNRRTPYWNLSTVQKWERLRNAAEVPPNVVSSARGRHRRKPAPSEQKVRVRPHKCRNCGAWFDPSRGACPYCANH